MDNESGRSAVKSDDNTPLEKPVDELQTNDDQYPHGLKLRLLTSASLAATFLISLDQVSACSFILFQLYLGKGGITDDFFQTIVGTAMPKITDEFHGIADVSWYAAAYFMTFGAAQPSYGKIYAQFNIK